MIFFFWSWKDKRKKWCLKLTKSHLNVNKHRTQWCSNWIMLNYTGTSLKNTIMLIFMQCWVMARRSWHQGFQPYFLSVKISSNSLNLWMGLWIVSDEIPRFLAVIFWETKILRNCILVNLEWMPVNFYTKSWYYLLPGNVFVYKMLQTGAFPAFHYFSRL